MKEVPTSILKAIILGITQGVTEFAPVSSSGHLILVRWLFGWDALGPVVDKTFDVALHLGTLVGALVYFRHDVVKYVVAWFGSIRRRSIRSADERLAWALVIGTIPGAIAGAKFEGVVEDKLGQPWIIAIMLAVFAVVLYAVDRFCRNDRLLEGAGIRTGLGLGIAQAIALQPGVSRSGITITAGRLAGLERGAAARFSFLLSLPIIAGAGLLKGVDLVKDPSMFHGMAAAFVAGVVASAVSGFLVIRFLLAYLRKHGFAVFVWYRLAAAALILVLIATGVRHASIP